MSTNFHPTLWGNDFWIFLHLIVLNYPNNPSNTDKNIYKKFFENLILPCKICQDDYDIQISNLNIDDFLLNTEGLFKWIIKIQNNIYKKLNKNIIVNTNIKNDYEISGKCPCKRIDKKIKFKFNDFIRLLELNTLSYPIEPNDNEKKRYYNFFNLLQYILPCENCKKYYEENFNKLDINLYSNNTYQLFLWISKIYRPEKKEYFSNIKRLYRDNDRAYLRPTKCCKQNRILQRKILNMMEIKKN